MMVFPRILCAASFLLFESAALASSLNGGAGTKGFKFLQVPADARAAATANASVAASGRQAMIGINPAGLAALTSFEMAASHTEWLSTVRHEYLGIAWPRFGGTLAFALRTQTSGDIPLRGIDNGTTFLGVPSPEPSGTYGVYDAAFTVAYARRAGSIDWGVGLRYIHEKIYFSSASAAAFDLGAQWHSGGFTAGFALRNIGRSGTMRVERVPLPWDAQAGIMYERPFGGAEIRTLADVRYAPDFPETLHLGLEVQALSALTVRAGYRTGSPSNLGDTELTVGTGIRRGRFALDYAYIPERDGLGSEHMVSLTIGR